MEVANATPLVPLNSTKYNVVSKVIMKPISETKVSALNFSIPEK